MATPTKRWMKLRRRFGRDGNPLRRRSDIIEPWLLPAAITAFLALCPLVALGCGAWVRADNSAAARAQLSWHRVDAILLQAVAGPEMADNGANSWTVSAPARWTVHGQRHLGNVSAAAGSRAGSVVPVWVDHAGNVRTPPLAAAQLRNRVISATCITLAILAMLLASVAWLAQRALDKRRLADWEAAWLAVGPRWSRQG